MTEQSGTIKKLAKAFGWLLVTLGLLIVLLLGFLQLPPGKNILRNQAVSIVNEAFPGSISLGQIRGNLFSGVKLLDVVLVDDRDSIVAHIDSIELQYNLLPLLHNQVDITSIDIHAPFIVVRRYADGVLNLETLAPPASDEESAPPSIDILLHALNIHGGTVVYVDEATPPSSDAQHALRHDYLSTLLDIASSNRDYASNTDDLITILRKAWNERDSTPPTTPLFGIVSDLQVEATAALLADQLVKAGLPLLNADIYLDTIPQNLPIKSANMGAILSDDMLAFSHENFEITPDTGWKNVAIQTTLLASDDGALSPQSIDQFYARIPDLSLDHELIHTLAPHLAIQTGLKANIAASGSLDKIYFNGDLAMADASGTVDYAGRITVPENLDDIQQLLELKFTATLKDINPNQYINNDALADIDTELERVDVGLSLKGLHLDTAVADIALSSKQIAINQYQVDSVYTRATLNEGIINIDPLVVSSPYLDAYITAQFNPAGTFQLSLQASSDLNKAHAAIEDIPAIANNADIEAVISATFNPDVQPVQQSLHSGEFAAKWHLENAAIEENKAQRLEGNLAATLSRRFNTGDEQYILKLSSTASGHGISTPELVAAAFTSTVEADATIQPDLQLSVETIDQLNSEILFSATGIQAPDIRLTSLETAFQIAKNRHGQSPFTFAMTTTLPGIAAHGLTISHLATDVNGTLSLDMDADQHEMIQHIELDNTLRIRDLSYSDVRIPLLNMDTDLQGTVFDLRGDSTIDASDIVASEQRIDSAHLEFALLGDRFIDLGLVIQRATPPVDDLQVGLSTRYHNDLAGIDLTSLWLELPGMRWQTTDESSISMRAESIDFNSFSFLNRHTEDDPVQRIYADGHFRPRGLNNITAGIEALNLEALHANLLANSIAPIQGLVDLDISLQGTSDHPIISSRTRLQNIYYDGHGPFDSNWKVHYQNDKFAMEDFTFSAYQHDLVTAKADIPVRVDLHGTTNLLWDKELTLNTRIIPFTITDLTQITDLIAEYDIDGHLDGNLNLSGTLRAPILDGHFSLTDGQFHGEVGDDVIDLDHLSILTDLRFTPPTTQRDGIVINHQIEYGSDRIFTFNLSSPLPLSEWLYDVLEHQKPIDFGSTNDLLNTPFALRAEIPGFRLDSIPLQSLKDMYLTGDIFMDADIYGTALDPRGYIKADLQSLGFQQFRDIFLDIDMTVQDQVLELENLSLEWDADDLLSARGSLPFPIERIIDGNISLNEYPLDFALQLHEISFNKLSAIDYSLAQIQGSIAGYSRINGTLRAPLLDARIGLFNTQLGDRRPGTISFEMTGADNRIRAQASLCHDRDTVLSVDADIPILLDPIALLEGSSILANGPVYITANAEDLDLAKVLPTRLIRSYVTDPAGQLNIDTHITGTWKNLQPSGGIRLNQGALTLPQFARRFENMEMDLELTAPQILLHNLSMDDGTGSIQASALLHHDQFKPSRVSLTAESRNFNAGGFATDFPVFISGNIDAKGDLSTTPQTMDIHINGLEVILPDVAAKNLHATDPHEDIIILGDQARKRGRDPLDVAELSTLRTSEDATINMRTAITIDRNSWARHPMGNVNIQANLDADIVDGRAAVTGQFNALRGNFEFLGRAFNVEESAIVFTGAASPNPRLQIEASHPLDRAIVAALGPPSGPDPKITIRVTGTATDPVLTLTSDPAMTDTEILFVLMTGRPPDRSDIGQDEGVASRALSAVSGLFLGMLQDQLAGSIPVDVLRLEAGERGFRGGRLEVGKYITNDVFVALRYHFGADENEPSYVYRLEYHFLPRWMMEILYSDLNQGELNVYWDVY